MREYSEVREIFCDLLSDSIKDGKIAIGDVEIIKNMLSSIEKTYKIEMFEEDGSYSRTGNWEADMRGTYARGSSYRGRKRDSMGRYSRDGRMGGYSRHDAKEAMMEQRHLLKLRRKGRAFWEIARKRSLSDSRCLA